MALAQFGSKVKHLRLSQDLQLVPETWNFESNKVNAFEEVWIDLSLKGKFYKQFKKNGFEYNYDILGEIFNSSMTNGKLSQASTQEPPTFDEEREIKECFLSKGVHIGSEAIDVDEDGFDDIKRKRKAI
ncbi:hypothetical protein VNO77_09166 [Canavalia gladiata]|uniref:Uncharacterized protein n=1 Tax=Canavalia gladiata TaxID=3824 RepID=A0AAN9QWF4_CANGL